MRKVECDICENEIKGPVNRVYVSNQLIGPEIDACEECYKPYRDYLNKAQEVYGKELEQAHNDLISKIKPNILKKLENQ